MVVPYFKEDQNQKINSRFFCAYRKSLQLARVICNYKSPLAASLKFFIHYHAVQV